MKMFEVRIRTWPLTPKSIEVLLRLWLRPVWNIVVCKTQMPPFPNMWRVGLTFDLYLWPTDLNVNRDHLLIKDYLPTKVEASGAKRCWVIRCTRFERLTWPLTLTFDLPTWLSIGIIYSSRTIYLPSLKLLGKSVVELSVLQGLEDWHDLWPTNLTINRDHLLIKDYLPTKFEASGAKRSWVISCTRLRATDIPTDWPTYRPTYRPTCAKQYAPPFSKGGINICLFPVTQPTLRFSASPKAFYSVFVVRVLFNTF